MWLRAGSWIFGSKLGRSSSFSKSRCGGLEPQTILDPNSQTNYPPTSLATRRSGLISKALRLWSMEQGVSESGVARVGSSLDRPLVTRELAKDRVRSCGSFWSNLTTSALPLHRDHDVVEQLALARVVFKSLPTHPGLRAGSWIFGSKLGRSSSFSKSRCGGLEPQTILDPNSQTNYPPTSLATRRSGLISKALRTRIFT